SPILAYALAVIMSGNVSEPAFHWFFPRPLDLLGSLRQLNCPEKLLEIDEIDFIYPTKTKSSQPSN
ncbi:hypothetical protein, partial [Crocosphaera watsonii]|uniref:hypothetical protein n=1 Tax=Crocosphaera watsonii TaxID=263511 RepID=UPI000650F364